MSDIDVSFRQLVTIEFLVEVEKSSAEIHLRIQRAHVRCQHGRHISIIIVARLPPRKVTMKDWISSLEKTDVSL